MADYSFGGIAARDVMAQGRTLVVGVAVAFYVVWALDFVGDPVILVPGFLYDASLGAAMRLAGLAFQFGFFTVFLLLICAGVGWARYVLAAYLGLAGLVALIISIEQGAYGGPVLLLAAVELAGAACLAVSLSVGCWIEFRRTQPLSWLACGLALAGLIALFLGVIAFDLGMAALAVRADRQQTAFAAEALEKFAPALNLQVIEVGSTEKFRQQVSDPDTAAQFADLRGKLGAFLSLDSPKPTGVKRLVLRPPSGPTRVFTARGHYEKGDVLFQLEEDVSGPGPAFSACYAEQLDLRPGGTKTK